MKIVLCIGELSVGSEHIHHQPDRFDCGFSTLLLQPDDHVAPLETSPLNKRTEPAQTIFQNRLVKNHTSSRVSWIERRRKNLNTCKLRIQMRKDNCLLTQFFHIFSTVFLLPRHNLTSQPLLNISFYRLSEAQLRIQQSRSQESEWPVDESC